MKKRIGAKVAVLLITLLATGVLYGQSEGQPEKKVPRVDLCNTVDMKPVLSLQQVNQAEFVHYLVVLSGMEPPSPEGMTPEEMYEVEVRMLIDAGYPPAFAEIEPDRLVTRRYFATTMYQVALETDDEFARKHGGLTDETEQLRALVEEEWLYAEEGRLYREEILSILCTHDIARPIIAAVEVLPEEIREAELIYPVEEYWERYSRQLLQDWERPVSPP